MNARLHLPGSLPEHLPGQPASPAGPPPPPSPPVLPLEEEGGRLYARHPAGLTPVYRFAPLRLALMCGQPVPFASEWPEYLKPLIYRFVPLPALDVPATPLGLPGTFGTRARNAHGLRPWAQATYNGWPLYYRDDPPGPAGHHAIPDLFELVQVTVRPPLPTTPLTPGGPSGGP